MGKLMIALKMHLLTSRKPVVYSQETLVKTYITNNNSSRNKISIYIFNQLTKKGEDVAPQ